MPWREVLARRGALIAVALAALFCLPAPRARWFADDYFHQLILAAPRGMVAGSGPWDLFTFADGRPEHTLPIVEHGPLMWLTWPNVRLSFLRPLSSASIALDTWLFGRELAWPHVESVLWYLALVAVVAALFKRTLGPAGGLLAPAAMVLFAIDDTHWLAALWLANRNSLLATTPVLVGLLCHLRWREDGWRPGLLLSLPCYAAGLACGEAALGALAYLLAYELFAGAGGWRGKALALAPVAALGAGYVVLYKHLHAGAQGSGVYIDPLVSPVMFLLNAPGRALALLGAQFLASPGDAWLLAEWFHPGLIAIGAVAVLLVAGVLRASWPSFPEPARRHLRWLIAGIGLSLLPVLATFPLNRLLLMPSLGAAALVAAVLVYAPRKGWLKAGVAVLFVCNVVLAPVGWAISYLIGGTAQSLMDTMSLKTPLTDEQLAKRTIFFVAPDAMVGLYVPIVRAVNGKALPKAWLCLSIAPYAHRLTRLSDDTFELEVLDGRMGETVFEQITHSHEIAYSEGMKVPLDGAEVTVTALDAGLPKAVRVRLTEPPSAGGYTFVQWKHNRLEELPLPAVGASIELPASPGMLAYLHPAPGETAVASKP